MLLCNRLFIHAVLLTKTLRRRLWRKRDTEVVWDDLFVRKHPIIIRKTGGRERKTLLQFGTALPMFARPVTLSGKCRYVNL